MECTDRAEGCNLVDAIRLALIHELIALEHVEHAFPRDFRREANLSLRGPASPAMLREEGDRDCSPAEVHSPRSAVRSRTLRLVSLLAVLHRQTRHREGL